MQKNVTGQKWVVFAFDVTDNTPKTGDANQITANLRIDGAGANAVDDTNPTELEDGYYVFDITQPESNGDQILIAPESSTGDIQVVGVPGVYDTTPPNFPALGIESDGDLTKVNALDGNTAQSADNNTLLVAIDGKTTNLPGSPAAVGSLMGLSNDAITAAKFDESTAFPVVSTDTGATQIARTGADGDTLETLSDQLDAVIAGGPGDFEITITIRTLGGVPIPGVSVWVNTSNDRSASVAGTKVTDANGAVVFNLSYTTYYLFCHLSGYTFAPASFTASAGNVTFTKDIGTAVSTGSSAAYDDSFITRATTDVRESLDEPTNKAKYTDARIITHLEKAYILVLNEINRNSKTQVVARTEITIADGVTKYALPHVMASVYGIYDEDDTGGRIFYDSRDRLNPYGRGMYIEGQTLIVQDATLYGIGTTITIEYIPSGIARLNNGTCTISADGLTVTFGATPNVGNIDNHVNAYAGSIFRHLQTDGTVVTGNLMQERTIASYDSATRVATLNLALDPIPTTDDGTIYYEIAPAISKGMDTVVALYAAYQIAAVDGNRKRAAGILERYRNEMRNVRLTAFYTHMETAPQLRGDNQRNRRYRRI